MFVRYVTLLRENYVFSQQFSRKTTFHRRPKIWNLFNTIQRIFSHLLMVKARVDLSWSKTCDAICYSVIITDIIIILFIHSLLPIIRPSVIKLPIMIIIDFDHHRFYHYQSYYHRLFVLLSSNYTKSIITNINYYDLFVSRTVL